MRKITIFLNFAVLFILISGNFACTGALDALNNLQRLKFKLGSVQNFRIANVNISGIENPSSLNIIDAANLIAAFTSGRLPADFTLNLIAKNPNTASGNTNSTATMTTMSWRLLIDNTETVNGNISRPITIPGAGQETTIPMDISVDLVQFFRTIGYDAILNLAFGIGGRNGSARNLQLRIKPEISTFLGPMSIGEITVVDTEWR